MPFIKQPMSSESQPIEMSLQRIRILIVEDDEYNKAIIATYLKSFNFEIFFALNGLEAVTLVRKIPDIHLILMDIHMPVLNGLDAIKQIKRIHPEIPIIIVTASFFHTDIEVIQNSGCDDYLIKPYSKADLISKIEKFLLIAEAYLH